jgi:hypothetical protein
MESLFIASIVFASFLRPARFGHLARRAGQFLMA